MFVKNISIHNSIIIISYRTWPFIHWEFKGTGLISID